MQAPDEIQRAAVVQEARGWLGTPYHHAAQIKGAGVDCAMLPAAVYRAAGLIPEIPIGHYPPDWHLHRETERYLDIVLSHAAEVPAPTGAGDFVLYRFGRAFAHGAIIVDWPAIIHAVIRVGVVLDDGASGRLAGRPRRFFTLWPQPAHSGAAPANWRESQAHGRGRPAFEGNSQ
ncbi:MAG TPA: hydrolase [Alphaproteobacteria bacterium]|nr:hydrolase [Alphaproteobacteria bacterium]